MVLNNHDNDRANDAGKGAADSEKSYANAVCGVKLGFTIRPRS
jgi:hypothetical protein